MRDRQRGTGVAGGDPAGLLARTHSATCAAACPRPVAAPDRRATRRPPRVFSSSSMRRFWRLICHCRRSVAGVVRSAVTIAPRASASKSTMASVLSKRQPRKLTVAGTLFCMAKATPTMVAAMAVSCIDVSSESAGIGISIRGQRPGIVGRGLAKTPGRDRGGRSQYDQHNGSFQVRGTGSASLAARYSNTVMSPPGTIRCPRGREPPARQSRRGCRMCLGLDGLQCDNLESPYRNNQ